MRLKFIASFGKKAKILFTLVLIIMLVLPFLMNLNRIIGFSVVLPLDEISQDYVDIGVLFPSHPESNIFTHIHKNLKLGLDIAAEEVNENGGINGKPIKLIYTNYILNDFYQNPDVLTDLVNYLIQNNISIIISSHINSAQAIAPLTEENKVILFSTTIINEDYSPLGDYVFRNTVPLPRYLDALTKYVGEELNISEVTVLYFNGPLSSIYLKDEFIESFNKLGGEVLQVIGIGEETEAYAKDFTQKHLDEFHNQLVNINSSNHPEAIFFAIQRLSDFGESYLEEIRNMNLSSKILLPQAITKEGLFDGVIYVDRSNPPADLEKNDEFELKLTEKKIYPGKWKNFVKSSYDGLHILANALSHCGEDTDCIKNFLYNITDYPGISGLTSFDENGDAIKPIIIQTIEKGNL